MRPHPARLLFAFLLTWSSAPGQTPPEAGPGFILDGKEHRLGGGLIGPALRRPSDPGSQRRALWVLALDAPPGDAELGQLERHAVGRLLPLSRTCFLCVASEGAVQGLGALGFVRWTGRFPPELKLAPSLRSLAAGIPRPGDVPAERRDPRAVIQCLDTSDERSLRRALAAAGVRIVWASHPAERLHLCVDIAPGLLRAVVRWPSVFRIEELPPLGLLGERESAATAGSFSSADLCPSPGYVAWLARKRVGGEGRVIQLLDDGIEQGDATGKPGTAHPDLLGAIAGVDNATGDPDADSRGGHGSLNAGLLVGRGVTRAVDSDGFLLGLGAAPLASVFVTKIFNHLGRFDTGTRSLADLVASAAQRGITVSANSWGTGALGAYDVLGVEIDALARDADPGAGAAPMTFVFAAGNAGDDVSPGSPSLSSPATAKNVIAVGAAESCDAGPTDGCGVGPGNADSIRDVAPFSSRGPTVDGRLGVTLVAPGTHAVGPASTSSLYDGSGLCDPYWPPGQTLYARGSGTSHAVPLVAGAALLFGEWYEKRLGKPPGPALIRAALAATAVDLAGGSDGLGGVIAQAPSYSQGWGRASLDRLLADDDAPTSVLFFESGVPLRDRGETWETLVFPASDLPGSELKVVLAWNDPPGAPGAGATLVNDLDLEIESGGQVYLGNVFLKGESTPGGEADRVNNLEGALLRAPGPAVLIRVRASTLSGDGGPDGDFSDQDFALVVTGATQQSSRGVLRFKRPTYACDSTVEIELSDRDLRGLRTAQAQVSSSAAPRPLEVPLAESPPGSGVFTGSLQLGEEPGHLAAVDGGELTALYEDQDGGAGVPGQSTDGATIDCRSPEVTSVEVLDLSASSASVRWTTDEESTGRLFYGELCSNPGNVALARRRSRTHQVTLEGLSPGTEHRFVLESTDRAGNAGLEDNQGSCFVLSTSRAVCTFEEDLEPAPEPGWTHAAAQGPDDWAPAELPEPDNPGLAWHCPGGDGFKDAFLITPALDVELGDSLTFRHTYQLERGYDGAVVEVSTDDGSTWQDLGPGLVQGGYSEVVSGSPLGDRPAWTGQRTGPLSPVRVNLDRWAGRGRLIRFRLGCDGSFADGHGWYVDDISLCRETNRRASIRLERAVYSCSAEVRLRVDDLDLLGSPGTTIQVRTDRGAAPLEVALLPAAPGSASFLATLRLGAAAGELPAQDGDNIQAEYLDQETGLGGPPVVIATSARVDCTPPVITGVQLESLFDDEAVISWETSEPAASRVEAGAICGSAELVVESVLAGTSHEVVLEKLSPGLPLRFALRAEDEAGNVSLEDLAGACRVLRPPARCVRRFDFEEESPGWEHGAALGEDLWRVEASPLAHSPPRAWVLPGNAAASDQALVSPPFAVPEGGALAFWHAYNFELGFDGGVAEISIDAGATWSDLGDQMTRGGYSGTLTRPNLLAGRRAWTGNNGETASRVVIDLGAWAGSVVQVRFRAVTDANVAAPGWVIDRVEVCENVRQAGTIALDRAAYRCRDDLVVRVLDSGSAGAGQISVLATSEAEPTGEIILLQETEPASGIFSGTLSLDAVDAPGTLQALEGSSLTISYSDPDDGSGSARQVSARATVDCTPPEIREVNVAALTPSLATVTWSTNEPATGRLDLGATCAAPEISVSGLGARLEHRLTIEGLAPATHFEVQVAATDLAGNEASREVPGSCLSLLTQAEAHTFEDDLEPGPADGWDDGGGWQVVESPFASSPHHVWQLVAPEAAGEVSLTTPPLRKEAGSVLELAHTFAFSPGVSAGVLEGSADQGETWIDLGPWILAGGYDAVALPGTALEGRRAWSGGALADLRRVRVSLDGLPGQLVLLRFRWASRGGAAGDTWILDDLLVKHDVGDVADLSFEREVYSCNSRAVLLLTDSGLAGSGKTLISVTVTDRPEPALVEVLEVAPGRFRAEVELAETAREGAIVVRDGDILRARHEDWRGAGGQPATVESDTRIDCTSPRLTSLEVQGLGQTSALLLWETSELTQGRAFQGGTCELLDRVVPSSSAGTRHTATLIGLREGSLDFVTLSARDRAGNTLSLETCLEVTVSRFCDFEDSLDPPGPGWTHGADFGADDWALENRALARSAPGAFHARNPGRPKDAFLFLPPLDLAPGSALTFWHTFELEVGFDGGTVEISDDGGLSWKDLGENLIEGAYTGFVARGASRFPAWTGGQLGPFNRVTVDLSAFTGQGRLLRLRINCDDSVESPGWYVDDFSVCASAAVPQAPAFLRGNCNADAVINLSDVIYLLNHLFRGGESPGCARACDTDHNDALNLTDAVYLLDHLFRGGPAPAPPAGCAPDLLPGRLGCESPSCAPR